MKHKTRGRNRHEDPTAQSPAPRKTITKMKKNNRITIIIAALLVVVAGVLAWNNRYLSTLRGDDADFMVWDTASVTKFYMADRDEHESLLERQPDGSWLLNKTYKAHSKQVQNFLTTLYKVRIKMPVSVASHDNIVKMMASGSTKVEVYQNMPRINLFNRVRLFYREVRTKVFYVGDATKDSSGTFMLKEGADKAYIVYIPGFKGFITTRFTANPDDWRDHGVFGAALADIESVTVEFNREPQSGFRVNNVGRHQYELVSLADGITQPYDTLKVINMLSSFSDLRFESLLNNILPQQRIDSIVGSPFLHRVSLTTKDGVTTQLTTYEKLVVNKSIQELEGLVDDHGNLLDPIDHDRVYGLINDGKDFVLIQYYVFDKVLNPIGYYVAGNPIRSDVEFYEVFD